MDSRYDAICGITEDELYSVFGEVISEMANKFDYTVDEMKSLLKKQYDGYHFSEALLDIYNPFSIINALDKLKLDNYWYKSGTPTYLVKLLEGHHVNKQKLTSRPYESQYFVDYRADAENPLAMLYQSGYLTIKNFDAFGEVYHLGIPNKEIRVGLFQSLLPKYLGNKGGRGGTAVAKMASLINRDDMDGALRLMKDFLSTVPYCDNTKYEGHYQQLLYIMFSLLTNYRMQVEVRTHKGRIDAVLETSNRIYVIETKLNGSAEEAMRQIEEKAYADAYKDAGKPVTKVGINFNVENEANFTEWVIK